MTPGSPTEQETRRWLLCGDPASHRGVAPYVRGPRLAPGEDVAVVPAVVDADLLEKAAAALYEEEWGKGDPPITALYPWPDCVDVNADAYRHHARTVIEALNLSVGMRPAPKESSHERVVP